LQEWLEDKDMKSPKFIIATFRIFTAVYPGSRHHDLRGTPELAAAVKKSLEIAATEATGWAHRLAHQSVGAPRRRRSRKRNFEMLLRPGAHLSGTEFVRRASAVPD
jgi:hypothetical protein